MSHLLKKSHVNIDSAQLLLDNDFYSSSVHCSYYSSYQILKYAISYNEGVSYEQFDEERKNIMNEKKKYVGSHEFYIDNKFFNLLIREKVNLRNLNKLNQLKTFRSKSDYENIEITENDSKKAINLSKEVIQLINKFI